MDRLLRLASHAAGTSHAAFLQLGEDNRMQMVAGNEAADLHADHLSKAELTVILRRASRQCGTPVVIRDVSESDGGTESLKFYVATAVPEVTMGGCKGAWLTAFDLEAHAAVPVAADLEAFHLVADLCQEWLANEAATGGPPPSNLAGRSARSQRRP